MYFLLPMILSAFTFFSCSGQELISETTIKKSSLAGEWYARASLVKKQTHSALAFTGLQCNTQRIHFEITKDKLLLFKSPDSMAAQRSQVLVGAFRIKSHLDSNAFRQWQDREFMEVDWSENLVSQVECGGFLKAIAKTYLSVNDEQDPTEPFRVRVGENYIETTVNAQVSPDQNTCQQLSELDCHEAQYRVKYSFKKIDVKNDYEPLDYPDSEPLYYGQNLKGDICLYGEKNCVNKKALWLYRDPLKTKLCDPLADNVQECQPVAIKRNAQFGFFRTKIKNYSYQEGFATTGLSHAINRFNLWEKTIDENGLLIPLEKRIPKKIVYYLNPGFPQKLKTSVRTVEKEWNTAFAHVMAQIKNRCTLPNVAEYISQHKLSNYLINLGFNRIDNNTLPAICSHIYNSTKHLAENQIFFTGDHREISEKYGVLFEIRENTCNAETVIDFAHKYGFWAQLSEHGFSQITDDTVERACALLEDLSKDSPYKFSWQQIGDLRYNFINVASTFEPENLLGYGPISTDPITGEIISGTATVYLSNITSYAAKSATLMAQLAYMPAETGSEKTPQDVTEFNAQVNERMRSLPDTSMLFERNQNQAEAIANLFTQYGNVNHNSISSDALKELGIFDILGNSNLSFHNSDIEKDRFFSERSACFKLSNNFVPYQRLTAKLKGLSYAEQIEYLTARIFEATLLHELGHNIGLRHNFKGPSDALNFHPNFWEVSTNDFRMRSGLSSEELRSSSIMSYHKRFNGDFSGLGLYDYAALLSGYANKVEIFNTGIEQFVPESFIDNLELMDYQDLPYLFSGEDAEHKIINHYQEVKDNYMRGDSHAHMDIKSLNIMPRPENIYKRSTVDYEIYKRDVFYSTVKGSRQIFAVPYAFCTDEDAYNNDIFCQPFIYGASASEIVTNAISDFERARNIEMVFGSVLPTSVPQYLNHAYKTVYQPILQSYQLMYQNFNSGNKIFPAIHDLGKATNEGMFFISRVLQAVEPGTYCQSSQGNYELARFSTQCEEPIFIGHLGYNFKSDFNNDLVPKRLRIGYIYDKILALLALVDDQTLIKHEFSLWQNRHHSAGLYRVFAPQIIKLFTALYTNKWSFFAPSIEVKENKEISILYRNLFAFNKDREVQKNLIEPSFSKEFKDYAIIISMGGLSSLVDHKLDFAKRAHITRTNVSKENSDPKTLIFKHPVSGVSYYARYDDDQDLSVGYSLLKDAFLFVQAGSDSNKSGPWYQAKQKLQSAMTNYQNHMFLHSASDRDLIDEELVKAQEDFKRNNDILLEKTRVIDQVARFSELLF